MNQRISNNRINGVFFWQIDLVKLHFFPRCLPSSAWNRYRLQTLE